MVGRPHTIAMVLAGGEGQRLHPLTRSRAKPAVPFGGHYRLIDFVLSNLTNARFLRIVVITQYKSHSLDRHIAQSWRLSPSLGEYVVPVPAQMRRGKRWFAGSADAIYQNFNILDDEAPDYVLVFGADHVYRMDPGQMLDAHIRSGAGVTVAGLRVPIEEAIQFGVIEAAEDGRITGFLEKPENPRPLPDDPSSVYASMGNYIFTTEVLREAVLADAADRSSRHDVGGSLIPWLTERGEAHVYDFQQNIVPGQSEREHRYWRDVGTIEAFFDAHMDLVSDDPVFDLYNPEWPINSWQPMRPPAKMVTPAGGDHGHVIDSILCDGVIVSGATVRRSVLAPDVRIDAGAVVEDAVLMEGVRIGRGAVVRRAIVDKNVRIPAGYRLEDSAAAPGEPVIRTESGILVVGKGDRIVPV